MTDLLTISNFKKYLLQAITEPLPGKAAQVLMSPSSRVNPLSMEQRDDAVKSGVLLLLYPKNDETFICFMRRTSDGHAHSGQISFPGGKAEKFDKDITETALRETYEEIGVEPNRIQVIGQLTDLYIPLSNFLVKPVLGIMDCTPIFKINKAEVSYIIEVPLSVFFDQNTRKEKEMKRNGYKFTAPYYEIGKDHIWGASSMIMSELVEILKQ